MNDIIQTPDELPVYLSFDGPPEAQSKLIAELAAARLEFGRIEKDRVGQYGNQKFNYAPLGTLTEATAKPLADHGIVTMQFITNSPVDPSKHRLTTMIAGHGARISTALDFVPQQAKEDGAYKGEWIKEYGKLCTYLCRYQYRTTFVLDSEPDADDAPQEQPQKRREAPRPEPRPEPPRQPAAPAQPKPAPVVSKPEPEVKPDAKIVTVAGGTAEARRADLERKLSTPVAPADSDDPPPDDDLQAQFMELYAMTEMSRVAFNQLCMDTINEPSQKLRTSSKAMRTMMAKLQTVLAQKGAA